MSQEPFTIEYYSSLSTVYRRSLLIAIIHQNKNEERLRVHIIFLVLTPDHGHHIESYRSTDLQLLLHPQSLCRSPSPAETDSDTDETAIESSRKTHSHNRCCPFN